jgi:hypothetical protein
MNTPAITPTVKPLDQYENALIQYLKKTFGGESRLSDLVTLFAWRCNLDRQYVDLPAIAHFMLETVEKSNALGPRGIYQLYHDAAPDRQWQFGLKDDTKPREPGFMSSHSEAVETHGHWVRLIRVLSSRLRLTEVVTLPGYNHEAQEGPFAYDGKGGVVEICEPDTARAQK